MSPQPTATELAQAVEELLRAPADHPQACQDPPLIADRLRFLFQLAGGEVGCQGDDSSPNLSAAGVGILSGTTAASWKITSAYWNLGLLGHLWCYASGTIPALFSALLYGTGVGLLVAGTTCVAVRLWRKRRQSLTYHIPRYLNRPVDLVACSVAYLLLAPALHASRAASLDAAAYLEKRLSEEWGYHPRAAQQLVQAQDKWASPNFDLATYQRIYASLTSSCPEVHQPLLQANILSFLQDLPNGAGRTHQALVLQKNLGCLLNLPAGSLAGET